MQSTRLRSTAPLAKVVCVFSLIAFGFTAGNSCQAGDGLKGLMPGSTPTEVLEVVERLPASWQGWGQELIGTLGQIYENPDLDLAGQKAALSALHVKLATLEKALGDSRYASARRELVTLHGRLQRRVDLLEAILMTLDAKGVDRAARLNAAESQVLATANELNSYLSQIPNGQKWHAYLSLPAVAESKTQIAVPAIHASYQKLSQQENLPENIRQFLAKPVFASYQAAMANYLEVAANDATTNDTPEFRAKLKELLAAYELHRDSFSRESAHQLRVAYDDVKTMAIDGAAPISQVMRSTTMNFNLRSAVSEAFLSRFIAQRRQESGYVDDCILGAKVDGCQTTVTDVSVDMVPSNYDAKFDINLTGWVNSNTQGVTDQATIFTQGSHWFYAQKRISFNGDTFWTEPGRISVNANNNTVGAQTNFSWIPILGRITNGIAVREAEKRRPESEAIARGRVSGRVLPRFDSEVDREFGPGGQASTKFQTDVVGRLRSARLYPDAKIYRSTDSHMLITTRQLDNSEVGGSEPSTLVEMPSGVALQIHQSLMNNSLDRIDLAGKTLTSDELGAYLASEISRLTGLAVSPPKSTRPPEEKPITFTFDAHDPIRVRLDDGMLYAVIRAGLQKPDDEPIPPQVITIPLKIFVENGKVVVDPGRVSNQAVDAPTDGGARARQLTYAAKIKEAFEKNLKRSEYEARTVVHRGELAVPVEVKSIEQLDGWMTILMD